MKWALKCCSFGETSGEQRLVAFHHDGKMIHAQLLYLSLKDDDEDAAEAEFDRVVASFDLEGLGRRPPVPTANPPGEAVSGLFLNVGSSLQINPFGGMDYVVDMDTYYFEPDGLYATEPPSGASTLKDFCPGKPSVCGTYSIAGGKIDLHDVTG